MLWEICQRDNKKRSEGRGEGSPERGLNSQTRNCVMFINLNILSSLCSHSFRSCVFPPLCVFALSASTVKPCCIPQCQRALWQQDIDSGRVSVNMGTNGRCVGVCVCVSVFEYIHKYVPPSIEGFWGCLCEMYDARGLVAQGRGSLWTTVTVELNATTLAFLKHASNSYRISPSFVLFFSVLCL